MSEDRRERAEDPGADEGSGDDPRVLRTQGPASPAERRAAAQGGGSLDWVHRFRVTPVMLLVIFVVLGALWALFEFTDLFYVLFP
jgi:hypothetical protein